MLKRGKKFASFIVVGIVCLLAGFFAFQTKALTANALTNFTPTATQSTELNPDESHIIATGSETDAFGYTWKTITKQTYSSTKNGIATISNQTQTYRCISTAEDLKAIDGGDIEVNGEEGLKNLTSNMSGHYILTNDITITSNWTPIGKLSDKYEENTGNENVTTAFFQGELDGAGHKITGFEMQYTDTNIERDTMFDYMYGYGSHTTSQHPFIVDFGLFAGIYNASIHDLAFVKPYINLQFSKLKINNQNLYRINCGVLAGESYYANISNVNIQNLYTSINIDKKDACDNRECGYLGNLTFGGLIGESGYVNMSDCLVTISDILLNGNRYVNMSAPPDSNIYFKAGGLIGYATRTFPAKLDNWSGMQSNANYQITSSVVTISNATIEGGSLLSFADTICLGGLVGDGYLETLLGSLEQIIINRNVVKIDAISTKNSNFIHINSMVGWAGNNDLINNGAGNIYEKPSNYNMTQGTEFKNSGLSSSNMSLMEWLNSDTGISWLNLEYMPASNYTASGNAPNVANVNLQNVGDVANYTLANVGTSSTHHQQDKDMAISHTLILAGVSIGIILIVMFVKRRKYMSKTFKKFSLTIILAVAVMLAFGFAIPNIHHANAAEIETQPIAQSNIIATGNESDDFGYTWQTITKDNGKTYRCIGSAEDLDAIDGDGGVFLSGNNLVVNENLFKAYYKNMSSNYILTKDIDLRTYNNMGDTFEGNMGWSGWRPIGDLRSSNDTYWSVDANRNQLSDLTNKYYYRLFSGELDGAGYTIQNMKISKSNNEDSSPAYPFQNYSTNNTTRLNLGLFAGINGAYIHDLAIKDTQIDLILSKPNVGTFYTVQCGALAGNSIGNVLDNVNYGLGISVATNITRLSNINVIGTTISLTSAANNTMANNGFNGVHFGGLVGVSSNTKIDNCYSELNEITTEISDCNKLGGATPEVVVGGFIGMHSDNHYDFNPNIYTSSTGISISGSVASVNSVTASDTISTTNNVDFNLGGFVGYNIATYSKEEFKAGITCNNSMAVVNNISATGFRYSYIDSFVGYSSYDAQNNFIGCKWDSDYYSTQQGTRLNKQNINTAAEVSWLNNGVAAASNLGVWKVNAAGNLPIQNIFAYEVEIRKANNPDEYPVEAIQENTISNKFYSRLDISGIKITDGDTKAFVEGLGFYAKLKADDWSLSNNIFELKDNSTDIDKQSFIPSNSNNVSWDDSKNCWCLTLLTTGVLYKAKVSEQVTIEYLSKNNITDDIGNYIQITEGIDWDGINTTTGALDKEKPNHALLTETEDGTYTLTLGSDTKTVYSCTIKLLSDNYIITGFKNIEAESSRTSENGKIYFDENTVNKKDGLMTIQLMLEEASVNLNFSGEFEGGNGNQILTYNTPITSGFYGQNGALLGGVEIRNNLPSSKLDISKNTIIHFDNGQPTGADIGYFKQTDVPGYEFLGWKVNGEFVGNNPTDPIGEDCTITAVYKLINYTINANPLDTDNPGYSQTLTYTIEQGKSVPDYATEQGGSYKSGYYWVAVVNGQTVNGQTCTVTDDNGILTISQNKGNKDGMVLKFSYNIKLKDVYGNTVYFLTELHTSSYGDSSLVDNQENNKTAISLRKRYSYEVTINAGDDKTINDMNNLPNNEEYNLAGINTNSSTEMQFSFTAQETVYYPFMITEFGSNNMAFYKKDDFRYGQYVVRNDSAGYHYAVYYYGHRITSWTIQIGVNGDKPDNWDSYGNLYFVVVDGRWAIYSSNNGYLNPYDYQNNRFDGNKDNNFKVAPENLQNQYSRDLPNMGFMINILTTLFATDGHFDFTLTLTPEWEAVPIQLNIVENGVTTTYNFNYSDSYNINTNNFSSNGKTFAYFAYTSRANETRAIVASGKFNYQNIPTQTSSINNGYEYKDGIYELRLVPIYIDNIYKVGLLGVDDSLEGNLTFLNNLDISEILDKNDTQSKYLAKETSNNYADSYSWNGLETLGVHFYNFNEFWSEFKDDEAIIDKSKEYQLIDDYVGKFFAPYVARYFDYVGNCSSYQNSDTIGTNFNVDAGINDGVNYVFNNPKLLLNVFRDNSNNYFIFLVNGKMPVLPAFNKTVEQTNFTLNYWFNNGVDGNKKIFLTRLATVNTADGVQPEKSTEWIFSEQDKKSDIPYLYVNFFREFYSLNISFNNYGYLIVKIEDTLDDNRQTLFIKIYDDDGVSGWYTFNGNIYGETKRWEISVGDKLQSTELVNGNLKLRSGCNVYLYLGDASTSPEAIKTGNFDRMIGYRALNFQAGYNTQNLLEQTGIYNNRNQIDEAGTCYSYFIASSNIANKNYTNSTILFFTYNFSVINYSLTFKIDNALAGGFNVTGGQTLNSPFGAEQTLNSLNVGQNYTFNFTYDAALGYEFNEVPFTIIVQGVFGSQYYLPLVLKESVKLDDGSYNQTYTFKFTGTWLRQNYYYPINSLDASATNYNTQFNENANFYVSNETIGTMQIGTSLIEFNLKIKFKDETKTTDEYFVDELGNTMYTNYVDENGDDVKLVIVRNQNNNMFVMKTGTEQLGLQLINRLDGLDGQIYVKEYNGRFYTLNKSYAEAYLNESNTDIDARSYSLPYESRAENISYFVYNDASARVNYSTNKIINDADRTLYYVYSMTPLLTLDVYGIANEHDINVNERKIIVTNTSEYTLDNILSTKYNKKEYILAKNQPKTEDDFWADNSNNKLITKLYITKNVTTTIQAEYDQRYYTGVEYLINGIKLVGSSLSNIDSNAELVVQFIPKKLELEVNYYTYTYNDQTDQAELVKVDVEYLKSHGILDEAGDITIHKGSLYVGDFVGFVGFNFSTDYYLEVKVGNNTLREHSKFNESKDNPNYTYLHTIEVADFDYSALGKLIMDFTFTLDDNSMVNFAFKLVGNGGRADDNYGSFAVDIYDGSVHKDSESKQTDMTSRLGVRVLKGRKIVVTIMPNAGYSYYGYSIENMDIISSDKVPLNQGTLQLTGEDGYAATSTTNYTIWLTKDMYSLSLTYNNNGKILGDYNLQVGENETTKTNGTITVDNVYVGMEVNITRTLTDKEAFNGYYVEQGDQRYYACLDGWFTADEATNKVLSDNYTLKIDSNLLKIIDVQNGGTILIKVDNSEKFALELSIFDQFNELTSSTDKPIYNSETSQPIYYKAGTLITVTISARFKYFKAIISGVQLNGLDADNSVPASVVGSYSFTVTLNKDYLADNAIQINVIKRMFSQHTLNNYVYDNLKDLYNNTPNKVSGYANASERTYEEYYSTNQSVRIYEHIGSGENLATLKYIKIIGNDFVDFTLVVGNTIQVILPEHYSYSISGNKIIVSDEEGNVKEFTLTREVINVNNADVAIWTFGYTIEGNIDIVCEYVDYKTISAAN